MALVDDVVVVSSMSRAPGIGTAMMGEAMQLAAQAGCYKLSCRRMQSGEMPTAFIVGLASVSTV